jgi:hypothetical protein
MTIFILLAGCAILGGLFLFLRSERRRAQAALDRASALEVRGKHEAACFHYAVAASAGAPRDTCEDAIRALWDAHGPFEFGEATEDEGASECRYKSFGAGYRQLMLNDVLRLVGAQPAARSVDNG